MIHVTCVDEDLRSGLQAWLDRSQLVPPIPLAIDLRVSQTMPVMDQTGLLFTQPGIEIRSGGPDGGARIFWTPAPALAVLARGAPEATVFLSPAAVARLDLCLRTFMETVLIFLLRRAGWHHVHAATARDPSGRGWLIAGNRHAGKSTTAALLASQGWGVGSDDAAFLAPHEGRVVARALRAPIALRAGGLVLLGQEAREVADDGFKASYWPEELGSNWVPCVEPEVLLFTTVGGDSTEIAPIPDAHVVAGLVRWSAWVMLEPELAQQHLDLLARLAAQVRGYRVVLGRDLFRHPARLQELIAP